MTEAPSRNAVGYVSAGRAVAVLAEGGGAAGCVGNGAGEVDKIPLMLPPSSGPAAANATSTACRDGGWAGIITGNNPGAGAF